MKKSFLLLPVSIAILTACSSNSPAPIENVDGTLSPGVMQPVDNNSSGTWQPEIQQNTMPNTMGNSVPTGTQTPQPSFQPTYQPVQQPAAAQPKPTPAPAPVQPQTKTVTKTVSDCTSSGAINVPRNPNTNAPDYSQIQKGSYKGNTYKVNKGDTMFLIAYLTGMDVKDLASMNNMKEPYSLSVGQTLKISNCSTKTVTTTVPVKTTASAAPAAPAEPEVTYTPGANGTQIGSDGTVIGPIKSGVATGGASTPAFTNNTPSTPVTTTTQVETTTNDTPINANVVAPVASNVAWQWPTQGNVIQGFSNSDGGNKGVDISGSRGQAIKAAASGRVVYAGNALRGYGNLIIIKHNDDFLSAYAHNDKILVSDQQEVKAGQEIAKMGSTGTNAVKLHFEIRYKGKSVDPVRYLPRR
ncbi:MAG: murein hydrolase activator NlpD [Haemophilus parainfluenzae]|uniref:murein hydrolase activator NlpD n=1 Tax=uncultured Haemophilus sp. TaxID=237779 RepID=UPI0028042289|nr:murein hydrolase activator NlpD [uncultured Haemophilus sp.]MDU1235379.1 murein hydrolase activator NlpD [Haemophilus parainfluenzae]MDU4566630.1 murein hydrolase activator NlpD [Haemophilus parainfluenzae]MDU4638536.1 murein hydrolase activator NlpD [Haemophilus parainfluenzae]MDU5991229.1 murein hydrolase activator NlpD [Haemophilus parainfluenzae]MDU7944616.1 murein hydrolase activator NlpD [Haemophilus parainfluenzae]